LQTSCKPFLSIAHKLCCVFLCVDLNPTRYFQLDINKDNFSIACFFFFFWWRLYLSISEKIWPQKCIQPERIYYFVNHYYESSEICSKYVILCASFFFILKKKELFQYLQKIYKLVCCCFYYFILNDIFKWIVLTELHVILCNF